MEPEIATKSRAGRPKAGLDVRSEHIKVRVEPALGRRVAKTASVLGISRAELVRQGIQLYLDQMEQRYPELRYL